MTQKYRVSKNNIDNDRINTPLELTKKLVKYFNPKGTILDCCSGSGNFLKAFKESKNVKKIEWCEIDKKKDFFNFNEKVDCIMTNPPFSNVTNFLNHAYDLANDIYFILTIYHIWTRKRRFEREAKGFGIKEILLFDYPEGFPKAGFEIGMVHFQKNYKGDIKLSKL